MNVGGAQVQIGVGALRVVIVSVASCVRVVMAVGVGMSVVAVPIVGAVSMGIGRVVCMMVMVVRCLPD